MINTSIFEERWITLKKINVLDSSSYQKYRELCRNQIFPLIKKNQGNMLCILSGVIGIPTTTLLQMTQYPDLDAWRRAQSKLNDIKCDCINEEVRLFKPITSRPKFPLSNEYKRPFYTNRRFFIKNQDIDKAAKLSEELVWPLYEQMGCGILGLFTPIASTEIQEVQLIAGYNSLSHWEQTRPRNKPNPEKIDEKLWEQGVKGVVDRAELTLHSTVSFMRARYLSGDHLD